MHEYALVKMVDSRGVTSADLGLFLLSAICQNLFEYLPAPWEGRLLVRIIRAPHKVVHAYNVTEPDAESVFLEAEENVAVEIVAGKQVILEPVPSYPPS